MTERAKTEVDNARAVEAVRLLHAKVHDGYLGQDVCSHCSDDEDGRWSLWPCRTIAVIDEANAGARDR